MERIQINTRKKYLVKKLNNFRCSHCKNIFCSEELEVDHIIPVINGGTNDYTNLQCLCIDCHIKKTQGEWKGEFVEDRNIQLTPEESLEILKEYLEINKDKTYPDIQFLILNNKILSKFYYNSNILSLLYKQTKGIKDKREYKNKKILDIRDKLIYIIREEKQINRKKRLSYRDMEKLFNKYNFNMSMVQIRNICAKFGEKETKEDEQDIKNRKKDIEDIEESEEEEIVD